MRLRAGVTPAVTADVKGRRNHPTRRARPLTSQIPATEIADARLVWIGTDDCGIELEIVVLDLPDERLVIRQRGSRQQGQRGHVGRAHDAEIAAVDGHHGSDVQPLGKRDHRGVHGAQRQVVVLCHEFGDPL